MADISQRLTQDDCYAWIYEKIFPLRPADYCSKYPNWPGLVGIELEMLPIRSASLDAPKGDTVPLYGPDSISSLLFALQPSHPQWTLNAVPVGSDHLMNVALEESDQLSFEPGGQFEFSSKPYPCLGDALKRVSSMQDILFQAARERGIEILQIGMNPWRSVQEIGLQMNKPRYEAMDAFFAAQGPHGQRMMRQTCTVQLNLDFGGTEEVLAKRYLLANLISPMATAVFCNSPFLDYQVNGKRSNRADTWQHMDETRTGFPNLDEVERTLSRKACVDAYVKWVMAGRVVFIEALDFKVMDGRFNFQDWVQKGFSGVFPTNKDLQTHLSLQFPEVRARGFLELRSVDCQHRFWQAAPAAFYTGLLYDDKSLDSALQLLLPHRKNLRGLWKHSVNGLQDDTLFQLSKQIMELALEGFSRMPSCYHGGESQVLGHFYEHYTSKRKTPADELLAVHAQGGGIFRPRDLQRLETQWRKDHG